MASTPSSGELLQPVQLPVLIDNMANMSRLTKWKFSGPSNSLQTNHNLLQAAMNLATEFASIKYSTQIHEGPPSRIRTYHGAQ